MTSSHESSATSGGPGHSTASGDSAHLTASGGPGPLTASDDVSEAPLIAESEHLIDAVELIRQAFHLSLADTVRQGNRTIQHGAPASNKDECQRLDPADEDFQWFLGTAGSAETVPLLRSIHPRYVEQAEGDSSQRVLMFLFQPFNLIVQSFELTNWRDRRGNFVSTGDLVLFAFQLQTGVTTSRHITQLGHLPISLLERKTLTELIKKPYDSSSLGSSSHAPYDPTAHLTRAALYNPSFPVAVDCLNAFTRLFPQLQVSRLPFSLKIGHTVYPKLGISVPGSSSASASDGTPMVHLAKETSPLPTTKLFRTRLLERSKLSQNVFAPPSSCVAASVDLLSSNVLLRIDRTTQGNEVLQLFERHASHALRPTKSRPSSARPPTTERRAADKLAQPRENHSGGASTAPKESTAAIPLVSTVPRSLRHPSPHLSLFDFLKLNKAKPIIVVPSYLAQCPSSLVLHISNCQHFFEKKQLATDKTVQPDGFNDPGSGFFHWRAAIPWTDATGNRSSVALTIKVVDTSQVTKFRPEDWYRVMAVLLQGPEWQLSNWPFSTLEALFRCIKPIYFAYESDTLPPLVQRYGVEVLRVKRHARHGDSTAWFQLMESLGRTLRRPRHLSLFDADMLKKLR